MNKPDETKANDLQGNVQDGAGAPRRRSRRRRRGGHGKAGTAAPKTSPEARSRLGLRIIWGGAILFALALAAANILLGNLNQDEGWYLLSALRVHGGQLPYRDFLFTQGPGLPLVYGLLAPLWSWAGVIGGRVLTAVFGLAAAALAARLAGECAPPNNRRSAPLLAWLLLACAPVHSYFSAIPKTYALAALFLLAGFNLLTSRRPVCWMLGGAMLAFSAATRISLGLALPVAGVALLLQRRNPRWRGAWLYFGVGGALALLATYGVALLLWPADFLFSQSYHAVRAGGGLTKALTLRAGFASRCVQAYPLAWTLAAGLFLDFAMRTNGMRDFFRRIVRPRRFPVLTAAAVSALAVTLLHASSPFPYDDYQTPVMPLFVAAAAAILAERMRDAGPRLKRSLPAFAALAALLAALSSPLLMDWVTIRKDRFWFETKPKPDVLVLRDAAREVRAHADALGTGLLLTQDAYLAVQAGLDVPAGLEMGPFSIFPDMDSATARARHVHNVETLIDLIQGVDAADAGEPPPDPDSPTPQVPLLAATSGYTFALACPGTAPLDDAQKALLELELDAAFDPLGKPRDNFGQGHTRLSLWIRHGHNSRN